jgi:hypothetical protein
MATEQHKGKLRHVRIEPAENGYTVHAYHEGEPTKGDHYPSGEEEMTVHESGESAMKHVKKHLDAHEKHHGRRMKSQTIEAKECGPRGEQKSKFVQA